MVDHFCGTGPKPEHREGPLPTLVNDALDANDNSGGLSRLTV
jgi:hypothetical protein